jgi:Tfp pilus assembly protein PilO
MSHIDRRRRKFYLLAGLAAAIAIINVLFFFILYAPTRLDYYRMQDSISRLRQEAAHREVRVSQQEKIGAQLEMSDKDRQVLFAKHFIPASVGYAQVLPDLDRFAREAGVHWSRGDFSKDDTPQYGLYSVKIRFPVQGAYRDIVKFIRDLENSETFYVINAVDVRSGGENSFQPSAGNILLSLSVETYFYQ